MGKNFDFSGWATKANLKCSDGRVISPGAFKDMDGATVPLVWGHNHSDPMCVLGNAVLEHRDEGMYTYGTFNDTEQGRNAKTLVEHGDVVALSICAKRNNRRCYVLAFCDLADINQVFADCAGQGPANQAEIPFRLVFRHDARGLAEFRNNLLVVVYITTVNSGHIAAIPAQMPPDLADFLINHVFSSFRSG